MPGIGDPAPQFSGNDVVTGEPFSLADQQGRVVLLAFSGLTWCHPCQFEAPVLQDLWEDYTLTTQPHVRFVMASYKDDPETKLLQAIQTFGITFPVLKDPSITSAYGITAGVPQVFVIDTEGTICGHELGAEPPEEILREQLRQLLIDCGAGNPLNFPFDQLIWTLPVLIKKPMPEPDPPWRHALQTLGRDKREALLAMAIAELAAGIRDPDARREVESAALSALERAVGRMKAGVERNAVRLERGWVPLR
jgi:peroxiredoxin